MVANAEYAKKMQYRAQHQHDPNKTTDIFDGEHYQSLKTTPVSVVDETLPFCHFSDNCDIALGLSTDGFGPFKRRNKTAWPLVLFNYNLPPEERFLKRNVVSVGVIPGPKKPHDFDSFLWPLVQEFLQLAIGVSAFDGISKFMFLLHVYLIVVFGDIPAVSMVMRMKGQNGYSPCRMCEIKGIHGPDGSGNTYYIPLNREHFADNAGWSHYDPRDLPLRTHPRFIWQAKQVQNASTNQDSEKLAKQFGIKGIPLLSCLSSLSFPASFPYDFMHLIWANLIRNLIQLWTGTFKNLDHNDKEYVFANKVWEKIGEETAHAGQHIPASFGLRVPNIADEKSHMTCETYSIWTLLWAPIILRDRFIHIRYYNHFCRLVELLSICLQYEIETEQIEELEEGFIKWVEDYEQ